MASALPAIAVFLGGAAEGDSTQYTVIGEAAMARLRDFPRLMGLLLKTFFKLFNAEIADKEREAL